MKPRVIFHISTQMTMGGGERQLIYLYQGLQTRNCQQWIICAKGSALETYCKKNQMNYIALKRPGSLSIRCLFELKKIINNYSVNLIHCHDAHAHTHAVIADILFRLSTPLVIHRKVIPNAQKKGLETFKYRYTGIKKIICVSEAIGRVCAQWTDPNKIIVIPDTLNIQDYLPPAPHEIFTIGIIASLLPVKDHKTFLQCARRILEKEKNSQFWIIGEGPLRNELKSYTEQLNIASHVHFFGFREDIPQLLSQIDILLVTSQNEGLCSTILQAMAARVPVIARNIGGIPEIIKHKKTGFLAEDVDDFVSTTLLLKDNPALSHQITESARQKVLAYDLPVFIEKIWAVYESVMNHPSA